jgi:hypothetical protein
MRPAAAALTALLCLLLGGCGGSDGANVAAADNATLEQLWRASGDDVAIVPGTATHEPGRVRVSFVVIDADGAPVNLPKAKVWLSRGLEERPFLESEAKLERIGVPGGESADSTHIYVAQLPIRMPGTYWLLAEPEGGSKDVRAIGNVVVSPEEAGGPPSVGERAPASETPTLRSVGGDAAKVTTRVPPDTTLLEHSVAELLTDHVPFVVTFATPEFCSSRTCGPVVDVVEEVARRSEGSSARFVHVEVYEGNDPANGYNRWMQEWHLTTEPWTFVVGSDGRIENRFEGSVSVRELEAAVERVTRG